MQTYEHRMGVATFRTPYTTITAFIGLLAVLEQNPAAAWQALLQQTQVDMAKAPETTHSGDELSDLII
ncbi:BREX system ATP-binding domain-containing protein [Limnohabitans sp. DM1]|uniref:BREX system ATP-binding domain-containing protein n=1 Tax=Limnohabitans sp. DM1 TaxID=1597955 RepID=UPI001E440550|nr:BREX system ATP-binding domain-containing protein [Limnohabitans sp. DM1]